MAYGSTLPGATAAARPGNRQRPAGTRHRLHLVTGAADQPAMNDSQGAPDARGIWLRRTQTGFTRFWTVPMSPRRLPYTHVILPLPVRSGQTPQGFLPVQYDAYLAGLRRRGAQNQLPT